jgi:ADP-heptose:LPS heptosyltransferase
LFYSHPGPGPKKYARLRGLSLPYEYTEGHFLPLAALGLERNGCPIELRETEAGRQLRTTLRQRHNLPESAPLLGMNIGCGTPGAGGRRPNFELLSALAAGLQKERGMPLILAGAPFEREANREFMALHRSRTSQPIIDLAGETSISSLTGLINACALFISGDTGPYHMAVALGAPTLCIFNTSYPASLHRHPWVRCLIAPSLEDLPELQKAADELLAHGRAARPEMSGS